jgi:outer membrane protein insertion porin family
LSFDYPLTEYQYFRIGGSADSSQLLTNSLGSALQAQQWVQQNGHSYQRIAHQDETNNEYVFYGSNFKTAEALIGWGWDTRNRTLFADHGMRQAVSLSSTVPGSDVQYWVGNYNFLQYVPIYGPFIYSFSFSFDYGAPLGKTTALPPYRNYFAGGPDDVRAFRESRLGPKDQFGNPYGGNMKVVNRNEIILPMPSKWRSTARVSLFFDMGNVFSTSKSLIFYNPDGTVADYGFHWDQIKRSAGVSVQWLAPLGLFRFSLGVPLHRTPSRYPANWGDETEPFQFSIGQAF